MAATIRGVMARGEAGARRPGQHPPWTHRHGLIGPGRLVGGSAFYRRTPGSGPHRPSLRREWEGITDPDSSSSEERPSRRMALSRRRNSDASRPGQRHHGLIVITSSAPAVRLRGEEESAQGGQHTCRTHRQSPSGHALGLGRNGSENPDSPSLRGRPFPQSSVIARLAGVHKPAGASGPADSSSQLARPRPSARADLKKADIRGGAAVGRTVRSIHKRPRPG